MTKIFSNQIKRSKDKNKASSTNLEDKANEKSKPMIIIGLIVSLSSIFLLLFTIKNKFG